MNNHERDVQKAVDRVRARRGAGNIIFGAVALHIGLIFLSLGVWFAFAAPKYWGHNLVIIVLAVFLCVVAYFTVLAGWRDG